MPGCTIAPFLGLYSWSWNQPEPPNKRVWTGLRWAHITCQGWDPSEPMGTQGLYLMLGEWHRGMARGIMYTRGDHYTHSVLSSFFHQLKHPEQQLVSLPSYWLCQYSCAYIPQQCLIVCDTGTKLMGQMKSNHEHARLNSSAKGSLNNQNATHNNQLECNILEWPVTMITMTYYKQVTMANENKGTIVCSNCEATKNQVWKCCIIGM